MMRTVAQIHVEVNPNSAAAAEEYRGTIGGEPGSVGSKKQVGLQLIAQLLAHLSQIRRPDLLTRFNDEFGIETEPAAARFTNGAKGRQIDAVLSFIVGGAAAVDAIANRCRPPRLQIIPPFSRHARYAILIPVPQKRSAPRIFVILRDALWTLALRRF